MDLIKLALIKSYHLYLCIRILLWFEKIPLWNRHENETILEGGVRSQGWPYWKCHVNGTTFQSGLRFQTGLSSLWISCKCALIKTKILDKLSKWFVFKTESAKIELIGSKVKTLQKLQFFNKKKQETHFKLLTKVKNAALKRI